ncbi:MAG: hypothetical protein QM756_26680 [Polyangiaceae bacterium]
MAESRGPLRNLFTVLLFGGTALGLYNVYSDNADVRALGEKKACGERPCKATVTRESRSPISQSFTYQTQLVEKGKPGRSASVDVECQRGYFLLGEYNCTAQGVLP